MGERAGPTPFEDQRAVDQLVRAVRYGRPQLDGRGDRSLPPEVRGLW